MGEDFSPVPGEVMRVGTEGGLGGEGEPPGRMDSAMSNWATRMRRSSPRICLDLSLSGKGGRCLLG